MRFVRVASRWRRSRPASCSATARHGRGGRAAAEKGKVAFVKIRLLAVPRLRGAGLGATSPARCWRPIRCRGRRFSAFVRTTNTGMPPYSEKMLPNDDLDDIYAYLSSIPKPTDPKSIPLLNQ